MKRHHKVDHRSKSTENLISFDQYIKLTDLLNDKALNLPKDVAQKLKTSFELSRGLFMQELSRNGSSYFEILLKGLPSEAGQRQTDVR